MTRDEAGHEAERLGREHPERALFRWTASERDGDWVVLKLAMPGANRIDPLKTTTGVDEKPPQPDDPRTSYEKDTGGNWIA